MYSNTIKNILELFPIKLVGGFVVLDRNIGCSGCSFCLSNRSPLTKAIYRNHIQYVPEVIDVEEILCMLLGMKSISRAKVPVRFGHNTDCFYQWDYVAELCTALPEDHPIVALTRFPLPSHYVQLFNTRKNLVLKVTITPQSALLDYDSDTDKVLHSIRRVQNRNLFILIGPIARDSYENAVELINKIPPYTWIDIKNLTAEGILAPDYAATEQQIEALRAIAVSRNLIVTDYFCCKMRIALKRPFYKALSSPPYIKKTCKRHCPNYSLCYQRKDLHAIHELVVYEAQHIGLTLTRIQPLEPNKLVYTSRTPVSRGDETYLSEITNTEVLLNTIPGSQGGSFALENLAIHQRWERYGMLPASRLRVLAEHIFAHLQEALSSP